MSGKQKVKQSIAKRFKKTGTGKWVHEHAAHRHRLVAKSSKAKGLSKLLHTVSKGDGKNIKRAIPGS